MKAPAVHFLHQDELPKNVEIKNDMIEQIQIRRDRGFILGCTVHMNLDGNRSSMATTTRAT